MLCLWCCNDRLITCRALVLLVDIGDCPLSSKGVGHLRFAKAFPDDIRWSHHPWHLYNFCVLPLYPSHNSTAEKQKYELKQPSSTMTIEVQKCKLQHQSDPLNPNHCSIIHFVQLPEKSCFKQLFKTACFKHQLYKRIHSCMFSEIPVSGRHYR